MTKRIALAQPTLKCFECRVDGHDDPGYQHAKSAGAARAEYWRYLTDCCPDLTLMQIKVRRAPERDMHFPSMPAEAADLDDGDRAAILHAFGGGRHIAADRWGYRDHYCCAADDETMVGLVARGLMTGPHGVEPDGGTGAWVGAFFHLTDLGKATARAIIGQRELA